MSGDVMMTGDRIGGELREANRPEFVATPVTATVLVRANGRLTLTNRERVRAISTREESTEFDALVPVV
jgi:hypothetical protein